MKERKRERINEQKNERTEERIEEEKEQLVKLIVLFVQEVLANIREQYEFTLMINFPSFSV